jgi:hypothetical protein
MRNGYKTLRFGVLQRLKVIKYSQETSHIKSEQRPSVSEISFASTIRETHIIP